MQNRWPSFIETFTNDISYLTLIDKQFYWKQIKPFIRKISTTYLKASKVLLDDILIEAPPEFYKSATRYRARIDFISPKSRQRDFNLTKQCFLGVSLENRNFEPARFHSLLEWISRRFTKCTILVGDSIHRITLESCSCMMEQDAFRKALQLGRDFIKDNIELIASYQKTTEFDFLTCHDIQKTQEYLSHYNAIYDYFIRCPEFRKSVESFGLKYHMNDWKNLTDADREYRLNKSSSYFIEEFSIFSCLVNLGFNVMVYPGSFSTLAEISDNQFPGVSKELESLCVVSLNFKKR